METARSLAQPIGKASTAYSEAGRIRALASSHGVAGAGMRLLHFADDSIAPSIARASAHLRSARDSLESAAQDQALIPRINGTPIAVAKTFEILEREINKFDAMHPQGFRQDEHFIADDKVFTPNIASARPKNCIYEAVLPGMHGAVEALGAFPPRDLPDAPDPVRAALDMHALLIGDTSKHSHLHMHAMMALDSYCDKLDDTFTHIGTARDQTNDAVDFQALVDIEHRLLKIWRDARVHVLLGARKNGPALKHDPEFRERFNQTQVDEFRNRISEFYEHSNERPFSQGAYTEEFDHFLKIRSDACKAFLDIYFRNFQGALKERKMRDRIIPHDERDAHQRRLDSTVRSILQNAHVGIRESMLALLHIDSADMPAGAITANTHRELGAITFDIEKLMHKFGVRHAEDIDDDARFVDGMPALHTSSKSMPSWSSDDASSSFDSEADVEVSPQDAARPYAARLGRHLKFSGTTKDQNELLTALCELQAPFGRDPNEMNVDLLTTIVGQLAANPKANRPLPVEVFSPAYLRAIQLASDSHVSGEQRALLIEYLLVSAKNLDERTKTKTEIAFGTISQAYFRFIEDANVDAVLKRHVTLVAARELREPHGVVFGDATGMQRERLTAAVIDEAASSEVIEPKSIPLAEIHWREPMSYYTKTQHALENNPDSLIERSLAAGGSAQQRFQAQSEAFSGLVQAAFA